MSSENNDNASLDNLQSENVSQENMTMDIREILECSEQRIIQWEKDNPNIDLYDWFCLSCCNKVGNEIEENEK